MTEPDLEVYWSGGELLWPRPERTAPTFQHCRRTGLQKRAQARNHARYAFATQQRVRELVRTGRSIEDVARVFGINVNTVRSWVPR